MAHAATNCNCATWGPCPTCGYAWEPTFATVDLGDGAVYCALPDPPKKLTPVGELLPGIALTKAARIARKYKQAKRRHP